MKKMNDKINIELTLNEAKELHSLMQRLPYLYYGQALVHPSVKTRLLEELPTGDGLPALKEAKINYDVNKTLSDALYGE